MAMIKRKPGARWRKSTNIITNAFVFVGSTLLFFGSWQPNGQQSKLEGDTIIMEPTYLHKNFPLEVCSKCGMVILKYSRIFIYLDTKRVPKCVCGRSTRWEVKLHAQWATANCTWCYQLRRSSSWQRMIRRWITSVSKKRHIGSDVVGGEE